MRLGEKSVLDPFYPSAEVVGGCEQKGVFPLRELHGDVRPPTLISEGVKAFIS